MYIYLIGRGYLNLIHPYNFIEYVAVFVVKDFAYHFGRVNGFIQIGRIIAISIDFDSIMREALLTVKPMHANIFSMICISLICI